MRFRSLVSAGIPAMLFVLGSTSATAQDREPKRTLGGHNFVPIELLGDPFVGTYVRNSTGGGMAVGLQVAIPDINGDVQGYAEADIGYLGLGLEYQQNITNWLAFRLTANGGARLGTSVEALLVEGATALFGFGAGLSAQVLRTRNFALAASADFVPNKAYGISPLEFAQSVIEHGLDSTNSLLSKGNGRRLVFGARPAWAVTKWLGFIGQFEVAPTQSRTEVEEPAETERKKTQTVFGLGASVNLRGTSNTPLGFTVAYRHKSGLVVGENVDGGASTWNGGVFYTGRRSFVVGIDIISSKARQTLTADDIDLIGARLILRYDFR